MSKAFRPELTGGFDVVIGNPPYVRQEGLSDFKEYFHHHYKSYNGIADIYVYFIEKAYKLLNENGYFSFIVANKWLRANYGKQLREHLSNININEIIDFGDLPIFKGATTYPCIINISKESSSNIINAHTVNTDDFIHFHEYVKNSLIQVDKKYLDNINGWNLVDNKIHQLLNKINHVGISLENYVEKRIYYGIKTGFNDAFIIDENTKNEIIEKSPICSQVIKPFLAGKEIKRYAPLSPQKYLILFPKGWTNDNRNNQKPWEFIENTYPAIAEHLIQYKSKAEKRYDKGEYWWELRACEYYDAFEKNKIIYPNILKKTEFTYDDNRYYTNQKCFIISTDDKYLLGILNSQITFFLMRNILPKLRGGFYEPSYVYFKFFPIKTIDFSNPDEKAKHDRMVDLVEQMLAAQKAARADEAADDFTRRHHRQRIEILDRQIDTLAYELYGLTEEEVKIVEGGG